VTATPAQTAYTRTCQQAAHQILRSYSTSFSLATRTLPAPIRVHIASVYAMVRVADEIVDGGFGSPDPAAKLAQLDDFESRIAEAVATGFSTDVVVHAFAHTARRTTIGPEHWGPFFASMRADARPRTFDPDSLQRYIHGSAEVVGEMCVRAFFDGAPPPEIADDVDTGARALGSAFQKVNFLRDLAEDAGELGRAYFPGVDPERLTEQQKHTLAAEILAELDTAAARIPLLPAAVRPAVWTAHGIFHELTLTIDRTPAERVRTTRIRVSQPRKLQIAAAALAGRPLSRTPQPIPRTQPRSPRGEV
jgi:15-cis-phytoene synthase